MAGALRRSFFDVRWGVVPGRAKPPASYPAACSSCWDGYAQQVASRRNRLRVVSPMLGRRADYRVGATIALIVATAAWGSTFAVTKTSLPGMAPPAFISWRLGLAALILITVRPRAALQLSPLDRRRSTVLGAFLGAGFLLQTTGLQQTSAGLSGFLTGTAVILTPIVAAVFFRERVGGMGWLAVGLSTVGLGLLMLRGGALTVGGLLTVAGAACFAVHIAGLSRWASALNAYGLTAWSVAVAAALNAFTAGAGGRLDLPATRSAWTALIYLALVATCLGLVIQAWAQSVLRATTAAVIMTMEPVFAAAIAATVAREQVTMIGWTGGVLIVASMFVAELGPRDCCDATSPRIECC